MAIELTDFHSIFLDECPEFYGNLVQINKDDFNSWVVANFNEYGIATEFNEVAPNRKLIDNVIEKGYVHKASQCHYSAKAICLLEDNASYITGFVNDSDWMRNIITHSFNLINSKIVDFARITEELSVLNYQLAYLPHVYYGIEIPKEFVEKYREETFNGSMNPLLFEWYNEVHK